MTMHDDDPSGDDGSPSAPTALVRPRRGRLRVVAGVAGLAAVLGSGAYYTTTWLVAGDDSETREVTSIGAAPQNPGTSGAADIASASPGASTSSAAAAESSGAAGGKAEPTFKAPAERVREAREAAAKDGVKLTRPLKPTAEDPAKAAVAEAAKEVTVGSAKTGGAMRIVTARGDLSGQREIGWVSGGITRYGEVECSQRIKLYNEQEPRTRDSLLICWRTSADRSVIIVDTKIGGRPPVSKSLKVLEREWRKLG